MIEEVSFGKALETATGAVGDNSFATDEKASALTLPDGV